MRNWVWAAGLSACVVAALAAPAQALERIYVVRHAEKVEGWPAQRELDALWPLSAAGQARAERLAKELGAVGIEAVYATPTTRALATGLPLAVRTGCPLLTYPATADSSELRGFVAEVLRQRGPARAVLLIGHSNTVPVLLHALGATPECAADLAIVGGASGPEIQGYDGLWIVELQGEGCQRFRRTFAP